MFKKSKYGGFLKLVPKNDHIYTTVCHKIIKSAQSKKIASIKTVTYILLYIIAIIRHWFLIVNILKISL